MRKKKKKRAPTKNKIKGQQTHTNTHALEKDMCAIHLAYLRLHAYVCSPVISQAKGNSIICARLFIYAIACAYHEHFRRRSNNDQAVSQDNGNERPIPQKLGRQAPFNCSQSHVYMLNKMPRKEASYVCKKAIRCRERERRNRERTSKKKKKKKWQMYNARDMLDMKCIGLKNNTKKNKKRINEKKKTKSNTTHTNTPRSRTLARTKFEFLLLGHLLPISVFRSRPFAQLNNSSSSSNALRSRFMFSFYVSIHTDDRIQLQSIPTIYKTYYIHHSVYSVRIARVRSVCRLCALGPCSQSYCELYASTFRSNGPRSLVKHLEKRLVFFFFLFVFASYLPRIACQNNKSTQSTAKAQQPSLCYLSSMPFHYEI